MEINHRQEFKQNNYTVIRNYFNKDEIKLIYNYGLTKVKRANTMSDVNYQNFRPFIDGKVDGDPQIKNSFALYGDVMMDSLCESMIPRLNTILGVSLQPTYTYWRMYKNGDELVRHKDRLSCEISTTITVGYDADYCWPIFIEGSGKEGEKGNKCELYPGDLLVYKGIHAEHWREKFTGKHHMQVFTHYNDATGPFKDINKYDCRPHMGLPEDFKDYVKTQKVEEISKKLDI